MRRHQRTFEEAFIGHCVFNCGAIRSAAILKGPAAATRGAVLECWGIIRVLGSRQGACASSGINKSALPARRRHQARLIPVIISCCLNHRMASCSGRLLAWAVRDSPMVKARKRSSEPVAVCRGECGERYGFFGFGPSYLFPDAGSLPARPPPRRRVEARGTQNTDTTTQPQAYLLALLLAGLVGDSGGRHSDHDGLLGGHLVAAGAKLRGGIREVEGQETLSRR